MLSLTAIIEDIRRHAADYAITLYPPANDATIDYFEAQTGISFPDDIKLLYKAFNGFISEEDMFRLVPLDELTVHDRSGVYPFEYMMYCDTWQLEPTPNGYLISNIGSDGTKTFLTNNVAEFLLRFLQGGVFDGLYEWHKQVATHNLR
jgi:hypothetical protein